MNDGKTNDSWFDCRAENRRQVTLYSISDLPACSPNTDSSTQRKLWAQKSHAASDISNLLLTATPRKCQNSQMHFLYVKSQNSKCLTKVSTHDAALSRIRFQALAAVNVVFLWQIFENGLGFRPRMAVLTCQMHWGGLLSTAGRMMNQFYQFYH